MNLAGTILLDTINLSPSAQKATPKDFKIIGELEDSLTKVNGACPVRNEFYVPINNARTDISQLTPDQLLRKDCKVLKTPEITIAVPAVPLLSQVRLFYSIEGKFFTILLLNNEQYTQPCTYGMF